MKVQGEDFLISYDFSLNIASDLSRRVARFRGETEKRTFIMKRLLLILSLLPALFGAESDPAIRKYYNEKAQIRMRNFEMPEDVTIKLWADESLIEEVYHCEGDSVQVNTSGQRDANYASRPHYIYIAGNRFYENYENAIDNKNCFHTIQSQNLISNWGCPKSC